ncbi:MAG: LON peptidase substrate-binding domain-containing protein [Gammaproteobacteria bacterium]|nr:LON peptidase substrate-binding domain-containing protein [Gammaproteobacteria bacterium]
MSTASTQPLPLFPLNTVLFPNSSLALRIFEPRYLALVSHCLKQGHGFGVCLIQEGNETGDAAAPHAIGTLARITDWYQHPDGILGITVRGEARFRIVSTETQPDQQIIAHTELLPEGMEGTIPPDYSSLIALLHQSLAQAGIEPADTAGQHDDAAWVSYRLAELLPFSLAQKQALLEISDPMQRLAHIHSTLGNQFVQ